MVSIVTQGLGDGFSIGQGYGIRAGVGNWEGYAWLKVSLKTDVSGETVTLTTDSDPGKTYTITTSGTAYADYFVDLCCPDSPTPDDDPELWDSRYPLRNDGLPHHDPSGWGIGRIRGYSLSGGTNLAVASVSLVRRDDAAVLDCQPAFLDWDLTQTDESYHADGSVGSVEIVQATRCAVVSVDGRRSIVEPSSLRILETDAFGAPLWVYSGRNAKQFLSTLNACPGFAADHNPYTPSDGWHALDGSEGVNLIDGGPIYYAGWVGFVLGGGVLWNGDTPTNMLGMPIADSMSALPLQVRYHELLPFPGMGDAWGDAGYVYDDEGHDHPFRLRVHKILDAAVDGIAYGVPEGTTVTLKDAGGATVSTTTTDARGRFRMGSLPYGKGEKDHTVEMGGVIGSFLGDWDDAQGLGADDATQERWNARRWHRAVFRTIVADQGRVLALISRPDGRLYRITSTDTAVKFGRSATKTYGTWLSSDVYGPADDGDLARAGAHVAVLLVASGTAYLALVKDEGGSTLTTMTDGSATAGCLVSRGDGTVYVFRIDGGTLKGTLRNAKDLSLIDGPWSTNLTGLSTDARVDADPVRLSGNKPGIVLSIYDGTTTTYLSSDSGRNFA